MGPTIPELTERWAWRSAFLGAAALLPFLGAVVPAELDRGRINTTVAIFTACGALLWLMILVFRYRTRPRRSGGSTDRDVGKHPARLIPGGIVFLVLATANAIVLYQRGSAGFGLLAAAAAALWALSVASACFAAFGNRSESVKGH